MPSNSRCPLPDATLPVELEAAAARRLAAHLALAQFDAEIAEVRLQPRGVDVARDLGLRRGATDLNFCVDRAIELATAGTNAPNGASVGMDALIIAAKRGAGGIQILDAPRVPATLPP